MAPGHSAARSVSRLDGGRGAAIDGVAACGDARYARRGADALRPGAAWPLRHRAGLQHTIPICAEWRCACRGEIGLCCARLPCAVSRAGVDSHARLPPAPSLPPCRRESGRQGRTTGCGVSPARALRRGPQ